ncbi:MAG: GNAT family N-acetyltransferase [Oscillospiraceae bacterium]
MNGAYGLSPEEFRDWLKKQDDMSNGTGLEDWMVPQTTYWLYVDGVPVGVSKLRHRLMTRLRVEGGHIGYAIRKSARGKGYAKEQLALVVEAARTMGVTEPLLVTINEDNAPSIHTAMACKSRLEKVQNGKHYIWID